MSFLFKTFFTIVYLFFLSSDMCYCIISFIFYYFKSIVILMKTKTFFDKSTGKKTILMIC